MPNVPEIVLYKGIRFRRYPTSSNGADRNYYVPGMSYRKAGMGRLHQEIWKDAHGPIPPGCEIHHKDHNPLNNALDNLVCLSGEEHQAYHASLYTPEEREQRRIKFEQVRRKASNWHRSDDGRAWHVELGKHSWDGREPQTYTCEQCGAPYESRTVNQRNRFCSARCRAAARRASGVDNETRTCPQCGQLFTANRYTLTQCCSRLCAQRYRAAK